MKPIFARSDVELYKVARMKRAIAWDSVYDFIVDADAIYTRKSISKLRRRLRTVLGKIAPADGVKLRGGHTGPHFARHCLQCPGNDSPDSPQLLQLILRGNGHPETLDAALILAKILQ
jgi:hypothetical protein